MKNLWISFFLISIHASGQINPVTGMVTASGEPLESVQIQINFQELNTFTGKDGRFSFEAVPRGIYRITAIHPGFLSQEKVITIQAEELAIINFDMRPVENELEEVLIIDKRAGLNRKTPYNISTIEMQQLKNTGSPAGLMGALREVPGVYGAELGHGIVKPFIRGVGFTRIVTIYQGNKLENHQWGADHGLGLNDLGIGNVDLIKGPASVLYGSGALGGVILVNDSEDYLKSNSVTGIAGITYNSTSHGYRFKAAAGKKFRNNIFFCCRSCL